MFKAARVFPLSISPVTRGPCSLRPENRRDQFRPREAVSSVSADTWCCVLRSSPGSPHQHIRILSWKWSQACIGNKTLDFKLVFFVWLVCVWGCAWGCGCGCVWGGVLFLCVQFFSLLPVGGRPFFLNKARFGTAGSRWHVGYVREFIYAFPSFFSPANAVYRFRWPWPIFKVIGRYVLSCWHAHFPALRERQLSICSSCIFVFFSNLSIHKK